MHGDDIKALLEQARAEGEAAGFARGIEEARRMVRQRAAQAGVDGYTQIADALALAEERIATLTPPPREPLGSNVGCDYCNGSESDHETGCVRVRPEATGDVEARDAASEKAVDAAIVVDHAMAWRALPKYTRGRAKVHGKFINALDAYMRKYHPGIIDTALAARKP